LCHQVTNAKAQVELLRDEAEAEAGEFASCEHEGSIGQLASRKSTNLKMPWLERRHAALAIAIVALLRVSESVDLMSQR